MAFGTPVGEDQNSLTAGERGPILIRDVHLLEKIGHFNRKRIPERVAHTKGAGVDGYFEVIRDTEIKPLWVKKGWGADESQGCKYSYWR